LHEKGSPVRNDEAEELRRPTRAQALRRLAALYRQADAAYARFRCPASAECCQLAKRGRQPWLWPVEMTALEEALRRQGRSAPAARADGGCPLLDGQGRRCTVYEGRPFGCRTYFCERASGGRHPLEATAALAARLQALAMEADPEAAAVGPKPILDWLEGAR
jgi:Fe-S-cluster containining protein